MGVHGSRRFGFAPHALVPSSAVNANQSQEKLAMLRKIMGFN
jgi:hypothetical protein